LKRHWLGRPSPIACLGKVDPADYLHSGRTSIIGCGDFFEFFQDTPTLEASQWLDNSNVEGLSSFGRRIALPKPSACPDFEQSCFTVIRLEHLGLISQ
jgi:hypothetical protein